MLVKSGFLILFDSDGYIQVYLDIEKYFRNSKNFIQIDNNTN